MSDELVLGVEGLQFARTVLETKGGLGAALVIDIKLS